MADWTREICARFPAVEWMKGAPMSRYTTFRVGGPADLVAKPGDVDSFVAIHRCAVALDIPVLVVGHGSNLIVKDGGFRGLVLLTAGLHAVTVDENQITAEAGAMLPSVAQEALSAGLSGLEFASGIPGSIGGALAMNAGAYAGQMKDVVRSAAVLLGGEVIEMDEAALDLGYRHSAVLDRGGVALEVRMSLAPDDPASIRVRMEDLNAKRRDKQPLSYPSAGSTFKRPEGHFAGALIEQSELKGLQIGGARVSDKHAGFVINAGGATAADVLALIERIQEAVLKRHGVALQTEVRIVGED